MKTLELFRDKSGKLGWRLRDRKDIIAGHQQQGYSRRIDMMRTIAGIFGEPQQSRGELVHGWTVWTKRRGFVFKRARVVDLTKKGAK